MTTNQYIRAATDGNFAGLVLGNSVKGPVLVDFWARWVGPSQFQRELFARLVQEYSGRFLLVSVDADRQKALLRRYNVISLPTAKLFRHRQVVETFHGKPMEAEVRRAIDQHLVRPPVRGHARALADYRRGEVEQALRAMAKAALAHPEDLRIPADMARILIREGRSEAAQRLLRSLPEAAQRHEPLAAMLAHAEFLSAAHAAPPAAALRARLAANPDDVECRYQLGAVQLVADDYAATMEQLFEIARRDRGFRDDIGRRGLLVLFRLLGDEHHLVNEYRARLANLTS